jgi:hypothetical protein
MDCNLARQLLPFSRTGGADLDPTDRAALGRHVATCPACAAAANLDHAVDASLARAMRAVQIPGGFSARLNTRLVAARMAFYRRIGLRALLVVAAGIAGWVSWSNWCRPTFDAVQLAQQTYDLNGASRGLEEARGSAAAWLQQFDRALQAPDDFNYRLLAFAGMSTVEGLPGVPTLVFSRNDATMRVFVVREHAFKNLGDVREEIGGCTVETRRYPSMPGWVFIIVTAGAPPDAFRPPARPLDPA